MLQKIILTIATAALALACSSEGSVSAQTAANASAKQTDRRDQEIAELREEVNLLKQQRVTQNVSADNELEKTKKFFDTKKPDPAPQRPRLPPGPACGQTGPSVAYIDYIPAGLTKEACAGNCTIFINDTDRWVALESPGGEKKLICGGYVSLLSKVIDPEVSSTTQVQMSFIPPHRTVRWINPSGPAGFTVKYFSMNYNGTLVKTSQRTTANHIFPYTEFGTADPIGMACNASGVC